MFVDVIFRSVLVQLVLCDERCWLSIEVAMPPVTESTTIRERPSYWPASVRNVDTQFGHSAIGHRRTPCYTRMLKVLRWIHMMETIDQCKMFFRSECSTR